ncbi:MAG TPA: DUF3105 domain-containing protein [Thermoleophilaceae bacterium]|nr:DUF3105 domain-containing protein [Thermoleophilaceae bacterium]
MVEGGDPEEQPSLGEQPPATAAPRERRLAGYLAAGAAILLSVATIVVALASLGDGSESAEPSPGVVARDSDREIHDLLPEGGSFPKPGRVSGVREGARAAGCELESFETKSNLHIASPDETVRYRSDPPTSGRHHPLPAEDDAYAVSPDVRRIVHTLEHGRVVIWFDEGLPRAARASLKAFYEDDSHHVLLVPDTTDMPYAVAATAWNKEPGRYGTGRLLGCRDYGDDVFTALAAFRDRHRDRGPELVP